MSGLGLGSKAHLHDPDPDPDSDPDPDPDPDFDSDSDGQSLESLVPGLTSRGSAGSIDGSPNAVDAQAVREAV